MRILCSPTARKSPLKSICFSSENQDHCQMPGNSCFIIHGREARAWRDMRDAIERFFSSVIVFALTPFAPVPLVAPSHNAATASLTVFVTLAKILASLGRSMMSSSEIVINFRFGPFVREIRNILLEGVTGMTTCTAASVPFTISKNFCLPSSISSMPIPLLFLAEVGMSLAPRLGYPRLRASNEPALSCAFREQRVPQPRCALHLTASTSQQLVNFRH